MADQNSQPVYGYTYAHRGTLSTGDLFAYKLPQLICKVRIFMRNIFFFLFFTLSLSSFQYIGELFGQTWYRFGEGASHGDELFLMFVATDVPFVSIGNERDQKTSELVVTAWANFAKHLDPTPNEGEFGVRWPR